MHNLAKRYLNAFDRVVEFGVNHPLTTSIAAVTTLYMSVGNVATRIRSHKGDQESGRGEFLGGSSNRVLKAEALRELMRPVNKIARALNREQFPGVREKFYMPKSRAYEAVIGRAEAFIDAIVPIKTAFTERGLPATFDTELTAAKDALVEATADKNAGLATQVGGTAGLMAQAHFGLEQMRELDAILSYQYRDNPPLLAAWKSACHVQREPELSTSTTPPPASAPVA